MSLREVTGRWRPEASDIETMTLSWNLTALFPGPDIVGDFLKEEDREKGHLKIKLVPRNPTPVFLSENPQPLGKLKRCSSEGVCSGPYPWGYKNCRQPRSGPWGPLNQSLCDRCQEESHPGMVSSEGRTN